MSHLHRLWLLTIHDAATFDAYQQRVAAVAARYGRIERAVSPVAVAGTLPLPTVVNLIRLNGADAVTAFEADPGFRAVAHLRDQSVELLHLDGVCRAADDPPEAGGNLAARRYLVEVARLADAAGYAGYARRATAAMAPYGYQVEHRMEVTGASEGWPFTPDVVTVAYFDQPDGQARFEQDPAHAELEGAAYDAVVADSVWLIGSAIM